MIQHKKVAKLSNLDFNAQEKPPNNQDSYIFLQRTPSLYKDDQTYIQLSQQHSIEKLTDNQKFQLAYQNYLDLGEKPEQVKEIQQNQSLLDHLKII